MWTEARMETKWFLNVRIARSAGLARWLWGGTYWTRGGEGRDWKKVVRRVEDSLSETMWEMGWPWEAKKERVERKVRT